MDGESIKSIKKITIPRLGETSLKTRLRILFSISSIIPLLFVWGFVGFFVYDLYKQNTDGVIIGELTTIKSNVENAMENMKLISQQLSNDYKTSQDLKLIYHGLDSKNVTYVNALKSLRERIAVYEVSNPYINNVTYFYMKGDAPQKLNETSLIQNVLPSDEDVLSSQNLLTYYGPHQTTSVVSDYQVISMMREINITNLPQLYLYMESGYRRLDTFSTDTLDRMNAVYSVVSDEGKIIYTSKPDILPRHFGVPAGKNDIVEISNQKYMVYKLDATDGWGMRVFVPWDNYTEYMRGVSLGIIPIALLAIALSLLLAGLIWRSVNQPFRLFEQNLKSIMTDDIEANIKTINVTEFDKSFEYFGKMKHRILRLVQVAGQQQQEKSQLEIKQLLTKINPHFIHNTLDTLKWYSKQHEYTDVEQFVSSLNRLLMYNMEKDKHTTLESELLAIDDYLALQKYKYELDYQKNVNIPDAMLQTEMPRFLLQPLVENAITHGLEGNGQLGINVSLTESGKIAIDVYNSGLRMDIEKMNSIITADFDLSSNGIGLQYVVRMLEAKFPDAYSFNLFFDKNQNHIEIIIPFHKGGYYAKDTYS